MTIETNNAERNGILAPISLFIGGLFLLTSAVSYAQFNQDDLSLQYEIAGLRDEIRAMLPETEERRFLAQSSRWLTEHERVCGRKAVSMRCRQHANTRIVQLKKLKLIWFTLQQSRESVEKVAEDIPVDRRAQLSSKQAEWEKRHRSICFRDPEDACQGSLKSWDDDINAALTDMRYTELSKEIKDSAVRRLDKVETEYLSILPPAERDPFIQEGKASKLQFGIKCASTGSNPGVNFLTGAPMRKGEQYICEARASDGRAIRLDEELVTRNRVGTPVPTGCFKWADDVGVPHEDANRPFAFGGDISLTPTLNGVSVDLNYTGNDGHSCLFSIFASKIGNNFKYQVPDEGARCELLIRFTPHFLFFRGMELQSCEFALGCGFKAHLPDQIPLTDAQPDSICKLSTDSEALRK